MISLLKACSCFAGKCCIFTRELALSGCAVSWDDYFGPPPFFLVCSAVRTASNLEQLKSMCCYIFLFLW